MSRPFRHALLLAAALGISVAPIMGCGGWKPVRQPQMESRADADTTYAAVRQAVKDGHYHIVDQNDAARTIKVRSHVDESEGDKQSLIQIRTSADGKVSFTPSGHLVKGVKVHRKLNSEIDDLGEAIASKLKGSSPVASAKDEPEPAPAPAPSTTIAAAWNEPASDPKTWGPGDFTCLPVKIPAEDQTALKLRLSNGEEADLTLSLAYAPELCRSPDKCPVATGCPAVAFGGAQQVKKVAQQLVKRSVDDDATVVLRGEVIATIHLPSHGLIAKAMAQTKR